jgi:hypothetical protein
MVFLPLLVAGGVWGASVDKGEVQSLRAWERPLVGEQLPKKGQPSAEGGFLVKEKQPLAVEFSKENRVKLNGAIVGRNISRTVMGRDKKYSEKQSKERLKLQGVSFGVNYSVSSSLDFYVEETFLRKPDISKMFFSYKREDTTFVAGYTLVNFLPSHMKGLLNSSFVITGLVDKSLNIKRNLLGLSISNDHNGSGTWFGIYGNSEIHLRTEENSGKFLQKNDTPLVLFARVYKALYMTDTGLFHVGLFNIYRRIHRQNLMGVEEKKNRIVTSNINACGIETIVQKGAFNFEITSSPQTKGRCIGDGSLDVEMTFVLTGEQKKYESGFLHAIDVKNSVSSGGFGAFEVGLKLSRGSSGMENVIKQAETIALNWTPEKNIRVLFNVGLLTKRVERAADIRMLVFDTMLRISF